MDRHRSPRLVAKAAFWRGVAQGMRSSAGRRGFQRAFRRTTVLTAIGSFIAVRWVQRGYTPTQRQPDSASEFRAVLVGIVTALVVAAVSAWVWRRLWGRSVRGR